MEGARIEPAELRKMMGDPRAWFELAIADDGAVIGSVYLHRTPDESCYLGMLSVDPERQAAGVGRALLSRAEELARAWGCARMRITVLHVREELLAYYERRGYQRTGRTSAFPESARSRLKEPGVRMVEMEKPLGGSSTGTGRA